MQFVLSPYENGTTLIDFQGPKFSAHTKSVTVFVVDNSYSMNAAAEDLSDNSKERYGWSRLNVTQHAIQTMIATMGEDDWVCIIVFSNDARVQQAWIQCSDENRSSIIANVMSIKPEAATNFKAGLEKGFEQLLNPPADVTQGFLITHSVNFVFLTDGLPSEHFPPARGESGFPPLVDKLQGTLKESIGQKASMTTIAIGNDCNSKLLTSISKTFLHMPDPGSIAPFMVNLTARILATGCVERYALSHPVLCFDIMCKVPTYSKDPVDRIELGPVTFEQFRTILVEGDPGGLRLLVGDQELPISVTRAEPKSSDERLAIEMVRAEAVGLLRSSAISFTPEPVPMRTLVNRMQGNIRQTFEEEVLQGLDDLAKFRDWGRHYMLSIADAIEQQRRTNFRDVALSTYATSFEEQISNRAEDCFATLKPPEPALKAVVAMSLGVSTARVQTVTQMPDEFLRGGGCFGEHSIVNVFRDGQPVGQKRMSEVEKGDELMTALGYPVAVECVTFTPCPNGRAELVHLEEAYFTPWHPIRLESGEWKFANQLGDPKIMICDKVFNVVMKEKSAPPKIGNRYAAPLGHGIQEPVVEHFFWGDAVLTLLHKSPGYAIGFVELNMHASTLPVPPITTPLTTVAAY